MLKSKFYLKSSPIVAILIVAVIICSMFIPTVAAFADEVTYTVVTYDPNGGIITAGSTTQTLPLNSYYSLLNPPTVTRSGYTLYGWSVTRDTYTPMGQYVSNNNPTLYAFWVVDEPEYITITFNPNGGTLVGSSTLEAEVGTAFSSYTVPTATREGYTFGGWSISPTTTGGFGQIPDTDQTLYAVWNAIAVTTVTLTFNANGGTLSGIATVTATIGDSFSTVTKPTVTRAGYTFVGWSTSSTALTTISAVPDENATIYAIWQYTAVDNVTVTFNPNGGTLTGGTSASVAPNTAFSSVTKPVATREGYTFAGWSTNSNSLVSLVTVPSANITVYAYWVTDTVIDADFVDSVEHDLVVKKYTYTVTDASVKTTSNITLNSVSYSTYYLGAWYDRNDLAKLTIISISDGSFTVRVDESASDFTKIKDFALNYTVENSVTITFNPNGGVISAGDSTQIANFGADVSTLTPPVVSRYGYVCIGWSTSATTLTTISTIPETDTTLFAIWEYTNGDNITVTYNPNGGMVVTDETSQTAYSYASYATLTPPTVAREGYKLYGWSVSPDTYMSIGPYIPTSDVTLYAYWIQYCTITYELNGGDLVNGELTEYVPVYTSYGDLNYPDIERAGYRFIGWSNYAESYSRLGQAPDTSVRSNKTIYAFWLANDAAPVAITFNLNGGTLIDGDSVITVPCGSAWSAAADKAPTVEKTGYTFVGWSRSTQSLVEPSVYEFYDTTTLYAWFERNNSIIVSNDVNTDKIEIPYTLISDIPDYAELCKRYDVPETAFIAEIEIATKPIITKDVAVYLGLVSESNTKITMNEAVLLSLGLVDNEDIDTSETGKKLALLSYTVDYEIFDFKNMLADSVLSDITTDCKIFLILRPKAFNTQYVVEKIMIIGTDTTMTAVFAEDTVMKDELAKMELTYGDKLVYGIDNSAESQNPVVNWVSDSLNLSAFWSTVIFWAAVVVLAFILILIIRGIIRRTIRNARKNSRKRR